MAGKKVGEHLFLFIISKDHFFALFLCSCIFLERQILCCMRLKGIQEGEQENTIFFFNKIAVLT